MNITAITASRDEICFAFSEAGYGELSVRAQIPLVCGKSSPDFVPGRMIAEYTVSLQGDKVSIPRKHGEWDLLVCRFTLSMQGEQIPGVCYVTDFAPGFSLYDYAPPEIKRPIGTWVTALPEDMDYLRFGYMMTEIDQAWILTLHPEEDDIPHRFNGKTYYFRREIMELYERFSKPVTDRGMPFLIRFINRFHYQNFDGSEELFSLLSHPDYEPDFEAVEMSAFNLRTEEGFLLYCACLDFLFARYCAPDSPYGWAIMMDIGNEVNAPGMWHNMGETECGDFMEEYSVSLRLAWLLSRKYYAHYRINISLEHNVNIPDRPDPMRFYPARECLDHLLRCCRRDGDFDWGVAAHPYPENAFHPDFYHDERAVFSLDTPKITLKNMEVWPAMLSSPAFLYRGQPRRVIFDEQGFHTDDSDPSMEDKGAYGFVLAWLKMRRQPNIDLLLMHRYADMPDESEYGLKLGLRRALGYADVRHLEIIPGEYKKVCHAIRCMDTPEEEKWVQEARDYIGHDLFDSLLNPPPIVME